MCVCVCVCVLVHIDLYVFICLLKLCVYMFVSVFICLHILCIFTCFGMMNVSLFVWVHVCIPCVLLAYPQVSLFGPLFDGALIPFEQLPSLVRSTAINACLRISKQTALNFKGR